MVRKEAFLLTSTLVNLKQMESFLLLQGVAPFVLAHQVRSQPLRVPLGPHDVLLKFLLLKLLLDRSLLLADAHIVSFLGPALNDPVTLLLMAFTNFAQPLLSIPFKRLKILWNGIVVPMVLGIESFCVLLQQLLASLLIREQPFRERAYCFLQLLGRFFESFTASLLFLMNTGVNDRVNFLASILFVLHVVRMSLLSFLQLILQSFELTHAGQRLFLKLSVLLSVVLVHAVAPLEVLLVHLLKELLIGAVSLLAVFIFLSDQLFAVSVLLRFKIFFDLPLFIPHCLVLGNKLVEPLLKGFSVVLLQLHCLL